MKPEKTPAAVHAIQRNAMRICQIHRQSSKRLLDFVFGKCDIRIRNGLSRAGFSRKANNQQLSVQLEIREEKAECFGRIRYKNCVPYNMKFFMLDDKKTA